MHQTLGIDLGTGSVKLAYLLNGEPTVILNEYGRLETPAFISLGMHGEMLVGEAARNNYFLHPKLTVHSFTQLVGRSVDDPVFIAISQQLAVPYQIDANGNIQFKLGKYSLTSIEMTSLLLNSLKKEAELRTGFNFSRAVISLPTHFGERQVAAIKQATKKAGLVTTQIVHQTSAVALNYAYSSSIEQQQIIVVYCLGRVFDTAVVKIHPGKINVLGSEGDSLIGGDRFTDRLSLFILKNIDKCTNSTFENDLNANWYIDRLTEDIKIQLSDHKTIHVELETLCGKQINYKNEVTQDQFEQAIKPDLEESYWLVQKALKQAKVTPAMVDLVLMVGSSCKIPGVDKGIRNIFNVSQIHQPTNENGTVALGTAIYSSLIKGITCEQCGELNTMQSECCIHCQSSLLEPEKVKCPTCMALNSVNYDICEKCNTSSNGQTMEGSKMTSCDTNKLPVPTDNSTFSTCLLQLPKTHDNGFQVTYSLVFENGSAFSLPSKPGEVAIVEFQTTSETYHRGIFQSYKADYLPKWIASLLVRLPKNMQAQNTYELSMERVDNQTVSISIDQDHGAAIQVFTGQGGRRELRLYEQIKSVESVKIKPINLNNEAVCNYPSCKEQISRVCGYCGKSYCSNHTIIIRLSLSVCPECIQPILDLYATSARHAENLEDFEEVIRAIQNSNGNRSPVINYYFGSLHAQKKKFDDAITTIETTSFIGNELCDTRLVLANARIGRARERLSNRDLFGAVQDVSKALVEAPTLKDIYQINLGDFQTYQDIIAGQLDKAILVWEKQLETSPTNLVLIHRLAILYYQLLSTYEISLIDARMNGQASASLPALPMVDVKKCWYRLIAYWASVLYSRKFWTQWLEKRELATGMVVQQSEVDEIRRSIEEKVLQDIRDFSMKYSDAGDKENANRLDEVDVLWGFELATAKNLAECVIEFKLPEWPDGYSCGPTMMQIMQGTITGKPTIDGLIIGLSIFQGQMGRRAQRYISKLGRYHYLIDINGYDQVIEELKTLAVSPEAKNLLFQALCLKGAELLKIEDVISGIELFERAKTIQTNFSEFETLISDVCVRRSKAMLADQDDCYEEVISLLERARALVGTTPEICENLSASLGQRARIANNADNFSEAEKYLIRALELTPNDPTIQRFAGVTYSNWAIQLLDNKQQDQALDKLKRSLNYKDDPDTRTLIYSLIAKKAAEYAMARNRTQALQAMSEALRYDMDIQGNIPTDLPRQRLEILLFKRSLEQANQDNFNEAIRLLLEAQKYWDDDEILGLLGAFYGRINRLDEAIRWRREALRRNPSDTNALHNLCIALHNYGVDLAGDDRYNDAINYLSEAFRMESDPTTAKILSQVYANRGVTKYKNGDTYGARVDLQAALKYDPHNSDYRSALYRIS
jgi:tetratricopeptide (TPR) repeat protein/actin-like ATPase involved in cell morphogenesis